MNSFEKAVDDVLQGVIDKLPTPVYWRILVLPRPTEEVSSGGIVIAQKAQESQQYLTNVGKILAAGGEAFKSERFANETNLPGIGDWVMYGCYAGQKLDCSGVKLVILNDDEILAKVADPSAFKIHI